MLQPQSYFEYVSIMIPLFLLSAKIHCIAIGSFFAQSALLVFKKLFDLIS